jgi:hypothetical protein
MVALRAELSQRRLQWATYHYSLFPTAYQGAGQGSGSLAESASNGESLRRRSLTEYAWILENFFLRMRQSEERRDREMAAAAGHFVRKYIVRDTKLNR